MKTIAKSLENPWVVKISFRIYTRTCVIIQKALKSLLCAIPSIAGCQSFTILPEFFTLLHCWQAAASQLHLSRKQAYANL